jgi:hypothetical protein
MAAAPNPIKPSAPNQPQPLTPEQQQLKLQQQQIHLLQQAAMNTKKTSQSIDAVIWLVIIVVGLVILAAVIG